jgi:hypothetical protein
LNIRDISVYFLIISPLSFRAENNPDHIGSAQMKAIDPSSNQLQQFSIQQIATIQTTGSTDPPTQKLDVHSVKTKNPKATQLPDEKKKH